ncbi:MAG: hypothetical protein PUP90_25520 [Nostoc sp. S4]|nr:hypothetical protein [Nostoc sp. S4]
MLLAVAGRLARAKLGVILPLPPLPPLLPLPQDPPHLPMPHTHKISPQMIDSLTEI